MSYAIITGASAGIGLEMAQILASKGYNLLLVARRTDKLQKLIANLKQKFPNLDFRYLAVDLIAIDAPQKILKHTQSENLSISCLINNAGFGSNGEFVNLPLEKELEQIDLNIKALVSLCHIYGQEFKRNRSGSILNVSSTAGFQPGPYMSTYYATKAFVNSFSEGLYEELKPFGVSVTILCPGPVATEFASVAKIENKKLFKATQPATAFEVAEFAIDCMQAKKLYAIHGMKFKMGEKLTPFVPRSWVRKITASLNKSE